MSFDYRCYTKVTNGILERGCAPFFEDVCDNERNCEVCDGGNWCNNRTFHDTCIQCSGEYGCRHQPDPSLFTTICSLKSVENSEGCYLAKSGKTYTRGCMEDLSDVDRIQCQGQSDECQRCTSPNCNQKIDFNIDCYECNGKGNTRCARSENLTQISCDGYSKTCVTGIDGNGITHRGCVPYDGYSTRSPQFPDGFQRCFSNLCNGEVFPENRTKCYQCEGVDCTYVKYQDAILKPCYSQRDECYSYVSKDAQFYRGCTTDNNIGKTLCTENPNNCKICLGSACNHHQYWEIISGHTALRSHSIYIAISIVAMTFWLSFYQ